MAGLMKFYQLSKSKCALHQSVGKFSSCSVLGSSTVYNSLLPSPNRSSVPHIHHTRPIFMKLIKPKTIISTSILNIISSPLHTTTQAQEQKM